MENIFENFKEGHGFKGEIIVHEDSLLFFQRICYKTKVGEWNQRDFLLMHLRKGRLETRDSCVSVFEGDVDS